MGREPFGRIDTDRDLRERLLPFCRLRPGGIWEDSERGHRVGVLDAADPGAIRRLTNGEPVGLAVQDPPYNVRSVARRSGSLGLMELPDYLDFSRRWIAATAGALADDAFLYVWMGADQNAGFQPLPDFMILMREFPELSSRSLVTLRNQRGYGTQRNWMCLRQELLCYSRGKPPFTVQYTDIPKILRGYYKAVGGVRTENLARSRAATIRPGNVWVDIQQVFYRMEENVPGAYAQKPLAAIERILASSSTEGDVVLDSFAHSGTTLLAAERLGRRCLTCDIDPVFAEITIRRLEHYRHSGRVGWQCGDPFGRDRKSC